MTSKRYFNYLIFLLISLIATNYLYGQTTTDSLVNVLKAELKKKKYYDDLKEVRIDSLKKQLLKIKSSSIEKNYDLTDQLLDEYISYQRDSAIIIAHRLIDVGTLLNDQTKINSARIKLGRILISSGVFKEASDCLDLIDVSSDTRTNKYEYFHLVYWLNWALHSTISDTYYSPAYRQKEIDYRDSARIYADPETYDLELINIFPESVYGNKENEYSKYMSFLNDYQKIKPARAARLAYMYNYLYENNERSTHFYILAAIFDVRNATKETPAILRAGQKLFENGDVDNAYYFLKEGLDNANFFGSKLHKLEITSLLPQVTAQKILQTERKIMTFVIISLVLIFIIIWFVYSRTKLKSLNQKIISKNTELQNILQELEKSQRENSWILKVLAHDLRGTLAGSINLYEIFIHNQNLSPEEKKMLELLEESNQDALKTISDLLNIKSDNVFLKRVETELDKLILESTTLLQYKANEKSQVLKTNLRPIQIPINREKIRRVLDNILSNAIKFSSPASEIFVEIIDQNEDNILIKIADNGIGIPEEYRAKLFELDPKIRREGTFGEESFGLGLYICKQIVDQHRGRIWIENNIHQGTIFNIELPKQ